MNWLIITPAWGERCLDLFCGPALDSHANALRNIGGNVRYICHTDNPADVIDAVHRKTGRAVRVMPLPKEKGYETFIKSHAEALSQASRGEIVVFLNADMLISAETFTAIENRLEEGKKAVMCAATRTHPRSPIPRNPTARQLLAWTMDNAHPLTEKNFYGTGYSRLPATIYFRDNENVVMRGFHLHPLAIVLDKKLNFTSSVDWDVATNYKQEEVHVVTSADELAAAEISPEGKLHNHGSEPFTATDIVNWANHRTIPFHWWLFSHQIRISGLAGQFPDSQLERELLSMRKAA